MFLQGWYATRFVVCNEVFAASCAWDQDLKAKSLNVTNNVSHILTLLQINKLVVVHLKENQCVWNPLTKPPKLCLFFQVVLQCLLDYKIISVDLGWGLLLWDVHNVVIATPCQMPNNTKGIRFGLHTSIGFWSWRFHGSGAKKWQGNVVKKLPKAVVWEANKTHVGGGNISEEQKICNRIPHLELVDRGKGKERQKNTWATTKQ